jgi:hypothetical protein
MYQGGCHHPLHHVLLLLYIPLRVMMAGDIYLSSSSSKVVFKDWEQTPSTFISRVACNEIMVHVVVPYYNSWHGKGVKSSLFEYRTPVF